MCGLAGVLLYPTPRPAAVWAEIRDAFTRNLLSNEERGWHAAGVALVQRDGSASLHKQPGTASELITTAAYRDVLERLGPATTIMLGHTRAPTKGSPQHNANNHPLCCGHVLGIHNGHIANDDALFSRLGLPRLAEVDSEIIFRLLDAIPAAADEPYLPAVQARVALMEGVFAVLAVDLRAPHRLLALKHQAPLCVHYHLPWQALFFSSRYLFLRKAFGRSVITEALPGEHAYLFDADRLPDLGKQPFAGLALGTAVGEPPALP